MSASSPEPPAGQGGRSLGNGPSDRPTREAGAARLPGMPHVIHGSERRPLVPGRLLFDEADQLSVIVPASCKRTGRCHECVIEIRTGGDQLSPRTGEESFLGPAFRLACQAWVERAGRDIEFAVLRRRLRILLAPDAQGEIAAPDPVVVVVDGRYRADDGSDLGPATGAPVGVAIDVGTTTVVLELVDLENGAVLAVAALENPQRFGGSDVMTRISYDDEVPGELRLALRRALNHELKRLCADARGGAPAPRGRLRGRQPDDARPLLRPRHPPDRTAPVSLGDRDGGPRGSRSVEHGRPARARAGAADQPAGEGHRAARSIASHVGADASADLVAVEAIARGGSFLLVDIGTNSEIVVSDGTRILAASSPAGPAFEGGGVRYGMPGADGAIEAVRLVDHQFEISTIGDVEPEGICGSGLVDLLAELRRADRMSTRGGFPGGLQEVTVVPERPITLSRSDVGHLSIAKAATAVGQRVLLRTPRPATRGPRPRLPGRRLRERDRRRERHRHRPARPRRARTASGGSATHPSSGARTLLLGRDRRAELDALVRRIEHVELESEPDFFDLFTDGVPVRADCCLR